MRAALDIAAKDLRQRVRDRSALLIAIVAPFVLAVLFSIMLGGTERPFHADWAVVDLDGGEIAGALIDGPIRDLENAGVVGLSAFGDPASARQAVTDRDVDTAIIIQAGFSDAASSGAAGRIELVGNPDAAISTGLARSVLAAFGSEIDAIRLSIATASSAVGRPPDDADTAALTDLARSLPAPVALVDEVAQDRTVSTSTYYAAAMAILFVFLGAQFGVTSLLAEKRAKTLSRMVAAPIRPVSILAGKTLVSMILAVVSMSVIVIGTAVLLGARWGDPVAIGALILAAAIAATGIALLAVGLVRTEDQASSLVAIVTISLAVLGGSFFPVSQGSGLLSQLSYLTPHRWFLDGVGDVAAGGDAVSVAGPIVVLAVFGLVAGGIGLWRARRVVAS